jgi:F420-dependent oxidoreductase-like protein
MLAHMAAVTERIRLGVLVTGNTHRHPGLLANMAATIDVASGGRLELGLGAGWSEEEHAAYGIDLPPWPERFDRLDEACAVIDGLLTNERFSFDGTHYTLRDAMCNPKPIQRPRPPLLIGGKGRKRTLRIAAQWADEWNFPGGDPKELTELIEVLHAHCADIDRDPAEISISVKAETDIGPGPFAELVAEYRDVGADHLIAHFGAPHDPADLAVFAEALAPVVAD